MPVAVVAALLLVLPVGQAFLPHPGLAPPVTITLVGVALASALTRWRDLTVSVLMAEVLGWVVVAVGLVSTAKTLGTTIGGRPAPTFALYAVDAVLVVAAVLAQRWHRIGWLAFGLLVVAVGAELLWAMSVSDELIDVSIFTHDGVHALLSGHSPYGFTIADPYDAASSARFYAPELVSHGRVLCGYPYLPGSLLSDVPGVLLGDDRLTHLAEVLLTAVVARSLAGDRLGVLCAAAVLVQPLSAPVVLHHWTEPILGLALAVVVWALARRRPGTGGVGVVMVLLSKQYAVVFVPLARLVVQRLGRRAVVVATTVAAVVLAGFVLWDATGFYRSAIYFHSHQVLRPDSLSLSVALVGDGVAVPGWLMGAGSFLVGMVVAWLLQRRISEPGPWALAAAVAWSAAVLLSKQGQANYFWLISTLLLLGCVLHRPLPVRASSP